MEALKNALLNNRAIHPERTNATLERLFEVIENVLAESSGPLISVISAQFEGIPLRRQLDEEAAVKICRLIDSHSMTRSDLNALIDQLTYSEISTAEAIDLHRQFKIPVSRPEEDIISVKGEECWIMDTKGRWYLDMDSNYSATNLGMSNPELALGLYNQACLLISEKEDRTQIARSRFLKEIMSMMPEGLNQFYWQNSGGEAVDKSLKIAKAFTGTTKVIAFKGGFHGRTHGAVAVTWNEKYRKPFGLHNLDWVQFAEFNDIGNVKTLLDKSGAKIVILELVQGEEAGNRPAQREFVFQLWDEVHKRGGVIIDDEVQAGFGRTAQKEGDWFACMSYGVVPDIMSIGKSFGGGYPVTAVVTRKEISQAMQNGYDGSTFGGNPMAMTAALIATRQMREKNITHNVIERSAQMFDGLNSLKRRHKAIGQIQGLGLMMAFSMKDAVSVHRLQENLKELGIKASLATENFIRFLPLTIISQGEVDFFLDKLNHALTALEIE